MLGIIKKLFSWRDQNKDTAVVPRVVVPVKVVARSTAQPRSATRPATRPGSDHAASAPVTGCVEITVASIEPSLPEALRPWIAGALGASISVPVIKIIPQLNMGAVTLPLKELRACAPDLLAPLVEHDDVPVTLPLEQILKQLNPKHYQRSPAQRRADVPNDIASVFGQNGAPASTAPATAPATAPEAAPRIAMSAQSLAALHSPVAPKPPAPASAPIKPVAPPQKPAAPAPLPIAAKPAAPATTAPAVLKMPFTPAPAPLPAPAARALTPTSPSPAATNSAANGGAVVPIPFEKISGALPEEVRRELADHAASVTELRVPMDLLEAALKSGKVQFPWKQVGGWLQPPLGRGVSAATGDAVVELPLRVVAPIFMAHHRGGAVRKVEVNHDIPDLFQSGTGSPDNGAAVPQQARDNGLPAPAPRQTTPARPQPSAPAPRLQMPVEAPPPSAGPALEDIIGAAVKRLSPKEIIQNAARIPGVTGALLGMTDGLLVTSSTPASVKADNVAAFLPQMFGRMGQYTRELGLGQLQSLALTVEGGCWQVFKQPNIYFAVCGRAGEPMPFKLLAQIAAELNRQQT